MQICIRANLQSNLSSSISIPPPSVSPSLPLFPSLPRPAGAAALITPRSRVPVSRLGQVQPGATDRPHRACPVQGSFDRDGHHLCSHWPFVFASHGPPCGVVRVGPDLRPRTGRLSMPRRQKLTTKRLSRPKPGGGAENLVFQRLRKKLKS